MVSEKRLSLIFLRLCVLLLVSICLSTHASVWASSVACQLHLAEAGAAADYLKNHLHKLRLPVEEPDQDALWMKQTLRQDWKPEDSLVFRSLDGTFAVKAGSQLPEFLETHNGYSIHLVRRYTWEAGSLKGITIQIVGSRADDEVLLGSFSYEGLDTESDSLSLEAGFKLASNEDFARVLKNPIRLEELLRYKRSTATQKVREFPDFKDLENLQLIWVLRPLVNSIEAPQGTDYKVVLEMEQRFDSSGTAQSAFYQLFDERRKAANTQVAVTHISEPGFLMPDEDVEKFPNIEADEPTGMTVLTAEVEGPQAPIRVEEVRPSEENSFYEEVNELPDDLYTLMWEELASSQEPGSENGYEKVAAQVSQSRYESSTVHRFDLFQETRFVEPGEKPEHEARKLRSNIKFITLKDGTSTLELWAQPPGEAERKVAELGKYKVNERLEGGIQIVPGMSRVDYGLYLPYPTPVLKQLEQWIQEHALDIIIDLNTMSSSDEPE